MTFVHVRLTQEKQDDLIVEYLVESFDFNQQKEWEKIGKILINKQTKSYEFEPSDIWNAHKIIPPSIFDIEEPTREKIIKSQYNDYGWGAWSMLIHHWASSFIKRGSFPQHHPSSLFANQLEPNQESDIHLGVSKQNSQEKMQHNKSPKQRKPSNRITDIGDEKLTGNALLQKVKKLSGLTQRQKAKHCGYYTIRKHGKTYVKLTNSRNLTDFRNAVLAAKSMALNPEETKEVETRD
ncbi:hypothetical protein [Floridanema evergladense]|uniref:HNH homing endonuclease n=1 Tax=Floridaenema evergladense BLCC-F167 TaxID=3153639 RepID=A0ABV4WGK6_9CYAN